CCACATTRPSRPKTMARLEVVPWSRARMYVDMIVRVEMAGSESRPYFIEATALPWMSIADADVVEVPAEQASEAGSDDGHPPPAVRSGEDPGAPAGEGREEPRAEVMCGVDRVPGVHA